MYPYSPRNNNYGNAYGISSRYISLPAPESTLVTSSNARQVFPLGCIIWIRTSVEITQNAHAISFTRRRVHDGIFLEYNRFVWTCHLVYLYMLMSSFLSALISLRNYRSRRRDVMGLIYYMSRRWYLKRNVSRYINHKNKFRHVRLH